MIKTIFSSKQAFPGKHAGQNVECKSQCCDVAIYALIIFSYARAKWVLIVKKNPNKHSLHFSRPTPRLLNESLSMSTCFCVFVPAACVKVCQLTLMGVLR